MDSEEKQFWVLLTIFGAMVGYGPFLIADGKSTWSLLLGCIITVFGVGGILMLWEGFRQWVKRGAERLRLRIRVPLPLMGVIGVWILIAVFTSYIHGIRSDLDAYAMPRELASGQRADFSKFLSAHGATVTVHVFTNAADREATEYGAQIYNAIVSGGWNADFRPINPWDQDNPKQHDRALSNIFLALDSGLEIRTCIPAQPVNPDPKHPTPDAILGEGFRSAHIEVNGGGGTADCGDYSVNVLVGHRPTVIGDQEPPLRRFGRWLERLSYQQWT